MLGGYSFISVSSSSEQSLAWVAKTHSVLVEASRLSSIQWRENDMTEVTGFLALFEMPTV